MREAAWGGPRRNKKVIGGGGPRSPQEEGQIMSIQIDPIKSYEITSTHITLYHIISNHINSYQIISNHINSYQTISNCIKSYQIISNHITSYEITSIPENCLRLVKPEFGNLKTVSGWGGSSTKTHKKWSFVFFCF